MERKESEKKGKKRTPSTATRGRVRVKAAEIEGGGSYSEGIMSVQRVDPDRGREGTTRGRRDEKEIEKMRNET